MITGYFYKPDLKVYVDYYFRENNINVCRQLGYFDFKLNWQKVSTNTDLQSVFDDVTLESLNIEDLDYYNPPTLLPYAVEIPIEYRLPFRNGVFKLNAFEVPLEDYQDTKVVNLAYFQWIEFRAELDTKDANGNFVYQALKDSLMDLWDYVGLQVANQNLIVL